MNNTTLTQNEALVNAMNRLAAALEEGKSEHEWLTAEESYHYLHLARNTFQKLLDAGAIKGHSLHEFGVASTRYSRTELNQFMEAL